MTLEEALERFAYQFVFGADSLDLAVAKADLDAAYRAHVAALHLGETVDGRAA